MPATASTDRRRHERFRLAPMYTPVTARRVDDGSPAVELGFTGHAYDISTSGVRIELDEPLSPGENIELHLGLPGADRPLMMTGCVVWLNDESDDPGPRRMAVEFATFPAADDGIRLREFLGSGALGRAA